MDYHARPRPLTQPYSPPPSEVAGRNAADALQIIAKETASVVGEEFFRVLMRCLSGFFGARYSFITECVDEAKTRVRTLAYCADGDIVENVEFELAGTACAEVVGGKECYYPDRLSDRFQEQAGLRAFVGVPITSSEGDVLGHIAILHDQVLHRAPEDISMLGIFATRAGVALERQRAHDALHDSQQRLTHTNQQLNEALEELQQLRDRLHTENAYLQEEIKTDHNFEQIVGESEAIGALLRKVELVAPTDATVLLLCETGTGKELIARALHDRSPRKSRPLVKLNCTAMSAGLLESELFGHEKGAFTGAVRQRMGRFELADGGTLFLDEIGELPEESQLKLLRVLEEREFERVGGNRAVRVDVRVIAATNRDLDQAVEDGTFRRDLFYRLNVVPVNLPPLRSRPEDVPLLTELFLRRSARKIGRRFAGVSPTARERLHSYPWPGNVRELENVIERAVVLCPGPTIEIEESYLDRAGAGDVTARPVCGSPGAAPLQAPSERGLVPRLDEVEREHILQVMETTNGVIAGDMGAARILGLHPSTLRSRMRKLGLLKPADTSS